MRAGDPPAAPHPGRLPGRSPGRSPEQSRAAELALLRDGRVPGRLLYQSPAQSARWLAYHLAWSPSRTDPALRALYRAAARQAARRIGAGARMLVGLGCGGGSKDAEALESLALQASSGAASPAAPLHYVPVDGSPELTRTAAEAAVARVAGLSVHPLVADLSAYPALPAWLDTLPPGPCARLFTCYGMLPNTELGAFPRWLAGLPRPGDRLLVSANLSPGGFAAEREAIRAQYDNPPARRWYAGCLEELGLPGGAYELTVTARELEEPACAPGSAWQIEVRAEMSRPTALSWRGETIPFAAGESLAVFHSHRFTADAAQSLLATAGLSVEDRWIHATGEEGIFLCRGG